MKKIEERRVDYLFGAFNVLNIATDLDNFENWLHNNYNTEVKDILEGYKLFVEISFKVFLYYLSNDTTLGLEEDEVFYYANINKVKINKFNSNCEKAKVVKNIYFLYTPIKRSKNIKKLKENIEKFRKHINKVFENIFERYVDSAQTNIPKHDSLKYATYDILLNFIHNSRVYPKGLLLNVFENYPPEFYMMPKYSKYWAMHFKGFLYALKYEWYVLLGGDIKNTKLSQINPLTLKSYEFDKYFDVVEKDIVNPIEERFNITLGYAPLLKIKKKIPEQMFGDLLNNVREHNLTIYEKLDQLFLWYPVEFFNMRDTSDLTYGAYLFHVNFRGQIALINDYNPGLKVRVIKFVHPQKGEYMDYNDFSYAVLLRLNKGLGYKWLLLYDCCGDGSGNAYALDMEISNQLLKFSSQVDFITYTISKNHLKDYILKHANLRSRLETWEIISSNKEDTKKEGNMKGLIVELISLYILYNEKRCNTKIRWNPAGRGYDIVVENEYEVLMIECKVNLNNPKFYEENGKLEREILKLIEELEKYPSKKSKKAEFWVWTEPLKEYVKILEDYNIGYRVIPDYIRSSPKFSNLKITKIERIFDNDVKDAELAREFERFLEEYIKITDDEN